MACKGSGVQIPSAPPQVKGPNRPRSSPDHPPGAADGQQAPLRRPIRRLWSVTLAVLAGVVSWSTGCDHPVLWKRSGGIRTADSVLQQSWPWPRRRSELRFVPARGDRSCPVRSDYGRRFALAMCDLDRFKAYNDTHGHQAGDQALRAVATAIAREIRGATLSTATAGRSSCSYCLSRLWRPHGSPSSGCAARWSGSPSHSQRLDLVAR
jgi:Diguanylate cyclase, GGDEF domain